MGFTLLEGKTIAGSELQCGNRLWKQLESLTFHVYFSRVCCSRFRLEARWFQLIACYFPASWDSEQNVMQVYDLLTALLSMDLRSKTFINILGGDFNASIGVRVAGDDTSLGHWGRGFRNFRGHLLARWVLEHDLMICSRMACADDNGDSWTCKRFADRNLMQLDSVLASWEALAVRSWIDTCLPIGLDYRCVHCVTKARCGQER